MRRRPVPPAPVNGSHLGHGCVNNDRWESCGRVRTENDWTEVLPAVLIALPAVLAWWLIRHPRFAALALSAIWIYVKYGLLVVLILSVELAGALHGWRAIHRPSYDLLIRYPARSMWCGWWVYRIRWRYVAVHLGVTAGSEWSELPKIKKIKCDVDGDHLLVQLWFDQKPEAFSAVCDALARAFRAESCDVRVAQRDRLWLDFARHDHSHD